MGALKNNGESYNRPRTMEGMSMEVCHCTHHGVTNPALWVQVTVTHTLTKNSVYTIVIRYPIVI